MMARVERWMRKQQNKWNHEYGVARAKQKRERKAELEELESELELEIN